MRILALTLVTLLLLSGGPKVLALSNHPNLEAFEGTWLGRSLDRGEEPAGTATTVRGVGIAIRATETGFDMAWRTPGRLGVRSLRAQFVATGEAGRFATTGTLPSPSGTEALWARLDGDLLLVFRSRSGEEGGTRLARYELSVSEGRMKLSYTLSEGRRVLERAEAWLSRTKIRQ